MSAEERSKQTILLTRGILRDALRDTNALMLMVIYAVKPDEIEDKITEILTYLDKTKDEVKIIDQERGG